MGHDWSDDILIAKLRGEPQTSDELSAVAKLVLDRPKSDLLVDTGAIDEPSCQTLSKLTELCSVLTGHGRRCVFYNVGAATRRIFNLYGFDSIFEIADTSEVVLRPSVHQLNTGTLELRSPVRDGWRHPDNVRPLQKRKYVRLHVPSPLAIDVLLWHGGRKDDYHKMLPGHSWRGRLVDVSEGGAQVAINAAEETSLGKGRLVGLEFRPKPTESLLAFDAQIREMLPTADGKNICLGLEFVGLEANSEGRQGLQKLCDSEGIYYEAREQTEGR